MDLETTSLGDKYMDMTIESVIEKLKALPRGTLIHGWDDGSIIFHNPDINISGSIDESKYIKYEAEIYYDQWNG